MLRWAFGIKKCSGKIGHIDWTANLRDTVLCHNQNSWRVFTVSSFFLSLNYIIKK